MSERPHALQILAWLVGIGAALTPPIVWCMRLDDRVNSLGLRVSAFEGRSGLSIGSKGEKGDRGEKGEKGDQGEKGEMGSPGSPGPSHTSIESRSSKLGDDSPSGADSTQSTNRDAVSSKGLVPTLLAADATRLEAGAALLEVFKSENIKDLPASPVIRQLWKRDLECWPHKLRDRSPDFQTEHDWSPWYTRGYGVFPAPEKVQQVGSNQCYVARLSFYFQAKHAGQYSFTLVHPLCTDGSMHPWKPFNESTMNELQLLIGGTSIAQLAGNQPTVQGIARLEEGFHRVEFLVVSKLEESRTGYMNCQKCGARWTGEEGVAAGPHAPWFQAYVLSPDGFDSEPITKELLMLLPGGKL